MERQREKNDKNGETETETVTKRETVTKGQTEEVTDRDSMAQIYMKREILQLKLTYGQRKSPRDSDGGVGDWCVLCTCILYLK